MDEREKQQARLEGEIVKAAQEWAHRKADWQEWAQRPLWQRLAADEETVKRCLRLMPAEKALMAAVAALEALP